MARVFQKATDVDRMGARAAPWYVEWRTSGKRHAKKVGARMHAQEVARQIERQQLDCGFGMPVQKTWKEFRAEYETTIIPGMRSERSREESRRILETFESIAGPGIVRAIDRRLLDEFVAKRRVMAGKKPKSTVSAETIRKELRTIRAALSQANEWGYLHAVPSMPKVDGFETVKRFMPWEDFERTWRACDAARLPKDFPNPAAWWRALLLVFWSSGVRVGAILSAQWSKTDLQAGTITLPSTVTKQKREHILHIGQAVELLRAIRIEPAAGVIPIAGAKPDDRVFPWDHHRRTLDDEWDRIQMAAGIHLQCADPRPHDCTPSCHLYGFHDMRRSLATYNHSRVDFEELMRQMGHSCRSTTERYIVFAEKATAKKFEAFMPKLLTTDDPVTTKSDAG